MIEETLISGKESTDSVRTRLHFSDGVLDVVDLEPVTAEVTHGLECDSKTLDWGPWTMHMTKKAGTKTLEVCDYLGESLASFFGITTPKYQFEINEYHRMVKAEEEAQKEKDLEMGSWGPKINGTGEAVQKPPQSTATKESTEVLRF